MILLGHHNYINYWGYLNYLFVYWHFDDFTFSIVWLLTKTNCMLERKDFIIVCLFGYTNSRQLKPHRTFIKMLTIQRCTRAMWLLNVFNIDNLMQKRHNSSALGFEFLLHWAIDMSVWLVSFCSWLLCKQSSISWNSVQYFCTLPQCKWKTFMVHQTFVWWA